MSRRCADHRLATHYFRLMVCRKLCLPIYTDPTRPTHCGCRKPIDQFGDHFLTCQRFHPKTRIHNKVRDSLALILSEIGPHSGFIRSKADVTREPTNLIPAYPTSRPADVCITLSPTYVSPP
jgi:hypothetical protein